MKVMKKESERKIHHGERGGMFNNEFSIFNFE
jgi:hypothetical protein